MVHVAVAGPPRRRDHAARCDGAGRHADFRDAVSTISRILHGDLPFTAGPVLVVQPDVATEFDLNGRCAEPDEVVDDEIACQALADSAGIKAGSSPEMDRVAFRQRGGRRLGRW